MNQQEAVLLCKQILDLTVSCSDFKIPQLQELKKAVPKTGFDKIQKIILTNRIDTEIQNQNIKILVHNSAILNQKIDDRLNKISENVQSLIKLNKDQANRTTHIQQHLTKKISVNVQRLTKINEDQANRTTHIQKHLTQKKPTWLSKITTNLLRFVGGYHSLSSQEQQCQQQQPFLSSQIKSSQKSEHTELYVVDSPLKLQTKGVRDNMNICRNKRKND